MRNFKLISPPFQQNIPWICLFFLLVLFVIPLTVNDAFLLSLFLLACYFSKKHTWLQIYVFCTRFLMVKMSSYYWSSMKPLLPLLSMLKHSDTTFMHTHTHTHIHRDLFPRKYFWWYLACCSNGGKCVNVGICCSVASLISIIIDDINAAMLQVSTITLHVNPCLNKFAHSLQQSSKTGCICKVYVRFYIAL